MSEEIKLHSTMDADVWAKEFMRINPIPDLDTMRSWFANLIMCGWDHAHWKCEKETDKWKSLARESVEALQHQIDSCGYPKKVCSVCANAEKIIAKAREAGLK